MPNRRPSRPAAARSKALLLPMPRNRASDLILRTRLFLERLRAGDLDRGLIDHLAQICIISGFVARTGYSGLAPETFDLVEQQLARLLLDFEETSTWGAPSDQLLDGLTDVVNAYDHMLSTVRLEILAKASDYLDRLMAIAANEEPRSVENSKRDCHSGDARTRRRRLAH